MEGILESLASGSLPRHLQLQFQLFGPSCCCSMFSERLLRHTEDALPSSKNPDDLPDRGTPKFNLRILGKTLAQ